MPVLYQPVCKDCGHKSPGVGYVTVIMHVNGHASDATIIVRFASTTGTFLFMYTRTILNVRRFHSLCWLGIYLPRKIKVESGLSSVRDEFSVRYN